jgi:anti-sigma factor RsiW
MNGHKSELVTGLLDGQLRGVRRLLVVRHVRRCPVCAAEYRHQRHVRRLLKANPPKIEMSGSPEFFWSKVKTEIERRGDLTAEVPMPKLSPVDWLGQNTLVWATAAAVVIAALGAVWFAASRQPGHVQVARAPSPPAPPVERTLAKVERVSTAVPNTVATVLDTEDSDVTVIWISGLPWTSDMGQMKTLFANLDT